ncbi:EfeM/EfeO family lipoprotein [Corynebacterium sp. TAE3-ERU16]|uniref:EfeM/EfeO family lipoprotein n=1 Tax=Corynebacterium sp. TAE3-ERU16 TaxID=2849493 RepID=UPI001C46F517|nr:EfeM/EfeO family lipoprotein [Corynebacterium sp. TAE3-ERU16]MBV7292262.1 EfeM/EfeO family lipoprotein [Corynebacterium sp. TAE3-ERU16]
MHRRTNRPTAVLLIAVLWSVAACSGDDAAEQAASPPPGMFTVAAGPDSCRINADAVQATTGELTFTVRNDGDEPTDFTVTGPDGTPVGEVTGIDPDSSRKLIVSATDPGDYLLGCAPDSGSGATSTTITVTGDALPREDTDPVAAEAVARYRDYVAGQLDRSTEAAGELREAIRAGDLERARSRFLATRAPYMRIAPAVSGTAERLGISVDARSTDLEPGDAWGGMHELEEVLWGPEGELSDDAVETADGFRDDIAALAEAVRADSRMTAVDIADHAQDLIDRLSDAGIHGEIDVHSHTELADFQASLEGSRAAVEILEPLIEPVSPELPDQLDAGYSELQERLDTFRDGDGFVPYDRVGVRQRRDLSDTLDELTARIGSVQEVVAR